MKEKKHFCIWKKTVAIIVLLLSLVVLQIGVAGTVFMISEGLYVVDAQGFKNIYLDENMERWGKEILYTYYMESKEDADRIIDGCSLKYIVLEQEQLIRITEFVKEAEWYQVYTYENVPGNRFNFNQIESFAILMMVPKVKIYPDYIACLCFVAEHIQLLQWLLPVMAISGLVLVICSLVYLFCGAGWSAKEQKQTDGVLGFVPTDILLVFLVAIMTWIYRKRMKIWYGSLPIQEYLYLLVVIILILVGVISLAARVKSGNIWKNTVVCKLGSIPLQFLNFLKQIVKGIPLIWKTTIITFAVFVAELLVLLLFYKSRDFLSSALFQRFFLLWFFEKVLLSVILFYWMQGLNELKRAGKELAEGNSDYKVDTRLMFGHAKEHGERLNSISEGVAKAVNERMKSEHLKTELITNVSHDIKTPLTSIINYSDLIYKEETENQKIQEYAEVLHRQSTRLKKLIEDLMEASKVSTGNIEVNLEVCDIGVLLTQITGEFEPRMTQQELELIAKQPEQPVQILADSRLLWRVMDNLMSNICKYSQKGTRVYVSVEADGGNAKIQLKNISNYPLDISADELMERFVRGDRSRHTEGNGLGLSIAKSLTDVQGGRLDLSVDGDLFKVMITFPIQSAPIEK